jgi:Sugar (and other) transporter
VLTALKVQEEFLLMRLSPSHPKARRARQIDLAVVSQPFYTSIPSCTGAHGLRPGMENQETLEYCIANLCSWVYPTEIFPLASRAKGVALATVAFSIAGGVINEIVPYLINAIGFWVFILFALINLLMLIPIYLFYIGQWYR